MKNVFQLGSLPSLPNFLRMRNQVQVQVQVQGNEFSLPEDLLIDILLRLPLDSLLACKRVSKQWNNLINNPRFAQLYRTKSTFLFLKKGNLHCLFHDNNKKMKPRRIPIDQLINQDANYGDNLLLESSNKRVCVRAANGDFLVFDLLTGKSFKVIPEIPSEEEIDFYGFCYDRYANDYYIILVGIWTWYVYSFRDGGWKSIGRSPDATCDPGDVFYYYWGMFHEAAYCFSGNLHWIVGLADFRQTVAVLDLHRDMLNEIALPGSNAAYNYYPTPTLTELDGHLCCCDYDSFGYFDVWVMKEYGVEESWAKLLRIDDRKLLIAPTPFDFDFEFEWMTPPALYSRDEGGEVGICFGYDSTLRVFEYDLCKDEIRLLHRTTWVMNKIVRRFKRCWKKMIIAMVVVLLAWVLLTVLLALIIAHFRLL